MSVMRRMLAVTAATTVLIGAVVSVAAAQDESEAEAKTGVVHIGVADVEVTPLEEGAFEDDDFFMDDGDFEDWEPTAEELAEINAETEALVEYLEGLGFEVSVATDELGFTYVDVDDSTDEAIFEAMDDFYQQLFADEVASWSDAEKAEWNTGIDEFVAELAAEGIVVETEEIAPGVYDIVWTEELEEALIELEGDLFFMDDGDFEDWEPTAEELAEINAETEALVEYLEGLGFEVSVATDELGFTYVDVDDSTDEAIFEAMDDFYQQLFADEVASWSDAEKAEWNTGIDEFVAELAAEGIVVETEEIAPGVYDIVWTEELEEALCALEGDDVFFVGSSVEVGESA